MPADPDLDRLRDDVIARALKQYESRSDTLAKSVNGLVLFGFLFFFLILFPFISLHQQRHRISLQLQGIPEQIRLLGSSLAGYRALADGLAGVKSSIKQGPFELRAAIQRRFAEPLGQQPPTQQSPIQQGPQQQAPIQPMAQAMAADNMAPNGIAGAPTCAGAPASTEWMNCQVRRQVDRQFAGYAAQLESSVIEPAQRLSQAPGSAGPVADSTKLRQGLGKIQQAFLQRLDKEPEFWKTFGGKVDFYDGLSGDVDRFWSEYGFTEQEKQLAALLERTRGQQADYQARLQTVQTREGLLATRLEKMDSPFGKLPLGVLEGVHLFPLLLTFGFLMCTTMLTELAGLRAALEREYRERDPAGVGLTPREVALVAPLWLDPSAAPGQRRIRTLVLLTPALIAVVSVLLVLYNWSITAGSAEVSDLERLVYGTLYLVCALGGAYAWHQVQSASRAARGAEDQRIGGRPA